MTRPAQTRFIPLLLFVFFILSVAAGPGYAQQVPPGAPGGVAPFRLEDGTPLKLRLQRTISSADAHVDERVDFDVLEEIKVGNVVVISKGATAWGTVTEAQPKRRMGRAGKLNVNIDAVKLVDGQKAALRAIKDVKGGGKTGTMTGAMVATSIVFFPAAPLFLFMHGKDITIPKGTEITAYVNGDMPLNPAAFAGGGAAGSTMAASPAAPVATPMAGAAPPTLIMVNPSVNTTGQAVEVSASPYTVRGVVMDPTGLPTVTINGTLASLLPKTTQAAEFWSAPIVLQPGDNRFEVTAVNPHKAQARMEFVVRYAPSGAAPAAEQTVVPAPAPAAPNPKALSLDDITGLLASQVPSRRLADLVGQYGLKFTPTDADLEKVRQAGGDDALIEALRRASHP